MANVLVKWAEERVRRSGGDIDAVVPSSGAEALAQDNEVVKAQNWKSRKRGQMSLASSSSC